MWQRKDLAADFSDLWQTQGLAVSLDPSTGGWWKNETPTPYCMGKSAEVIERKGVAMAPLHERVRKYLKIQKIKEGCRFALGEAIGGARWRTCRE